MTDEQAGTHPPEIDDETLDPIPREDEVELSHDDSTGICRASFFAFDTQVTLELHGIAAENNSEAFRLLEEALAQCRRWERLFSRTLPHSDIARINQSRGSAVAIAPETYQLLEAALGYCAASQGTFDITIGPAIALWNFKQGDAPTAEQRAQACAHIDWRKLQLRRAPDGTPLAQLADPDASVDVGGIAKGWMADELLKLWEPELSCGMMVNLGGNVAACGAKADGAPWRVGIRNPKDPRNPTALLGAIPLRSGSVVTSGTYERAFTAPDGRLLHHILDPRTALPVASDAVSVTVVADRSLDAEGYSTTLLALGIDQGRALVRETPAILQAFFVDSQNRLHPARE